MDINTNIKVIVTGELFDSEGNLKCKFVKHNLITSAGYNFLADCMCNTTRPSPLKYIAFGSGTTEPKLSDTALASERVRKQCDYSHLAGSTYLALGVTLGAGEATGKLTEAGLFNASSGGVLFDRVVFPEMNKEELDSYRVSFTINFKELDSV